MFEAISFFSYFYSFFYLLKIKKIFNKQDFSVIYMKIHCTFEYAI